LQAEAEDVARDLGLRALLESTGEPVLVGSAALGLMVWRDLDFTVVCDGLDVDAVAAVGSRLAMHPRIRQVVFRNDTGAWNADPGYPDGLYLGLSSRSPAGHDWRSDIWFVDEPTASRISSTSNRFRRSSPTRSVPRSCASQARGHAVPSTERASGASTSTRL
jgi:hypothetical protein